jgi:MFS family permease
VLLVCALLLATQVGDPPPAPLEPEDVAQPVEPPGPDADLAPDERTDDDGAPVHAPPRPVSSMLSALVGAVGGGAGAVLGAVPAAVFALRPPTAEDQAFLVVAALMVLPSAAALVAGSLAILLVIDKPGMEDVAGVAICTGLSCVGAMVAALLVGLGAGGGCSGGGGCGSCGSGGCNDPTGGDPLDSPAVAHAGGASIGAIVGICVGVAVIAVEVDSTPRVRQEAITVGAFVGAGAGVLGAVLGGAIGGLVGADAEEGRRLTRPAPPSSPP